MLSRIKFELEPLVEEMLNHLPDHVWTDDSTTFFDPAIGGGQFVRAIEHRLRLHGHSDENISKRVFGVEESELHIRFAVNKFNLVGQYTKLSNDNFFIMDDSMKFDVVIGNPPYQKGNQILWRSFVEKSIELTKDNTGYLALVTPNSWASGAKNNLFVELFKKKETVYINMNGSKYFPTVGKDIGFWMLKNAPSTTGIVKIYDETNTPQQITVTDYPFFIRKFSPLALSIFKKIQNKGQFLTEFVERKPEFQREFAFPKAKYSSYKYGYRYDGHDCNFPSSSVVLGINMSKYSQAEVENLYNMFSLSIFKFLWLIYGASDAGSFGWILRNMPKLDLKKVWTDEDTYTHFQFTQDEIEFIKNAVK